LKTQQAVWVLGCLLSLAQVGPVGAGSRGEWVTVKDDLFTSIVRTNGPLPDVRYVTTIPHLANLYAEQDLWDGSLMRAYPAVGAWIEREGTKNQSIGKGVGWVFYPIAVGAPAVVLMDVGVYNIHFVEWGESVYPPPSY